MGMENESHQERQKPAMSSGWNFDSVLATPVEACPLALQMM